MNNQQKIYPLVIKDETDTIIDMSLSNEKGFKKSLERGVLWHLHAETGRLLPYNETLPLVRIKQFHAWYEAVLQKGKETTISGPSRKEPVRHEITARERRDVSETEILKNLEQIILERKETLPEGSYTTHLFTSGGEKIRKKTGEEAVELILAADRNAIIYEAADLIYHMMVLLASENIQFTMVLQELASRFS